jgi:hypothetical protein
MKLINYKTTILKVHPPISGITAHATMPARMEHSIIYLALLQAFDPNEWCLKMVSSAGV